MHDAGINVRTFRAYRDKYNFIPAAWPAKDTVPDARVLLSIRPVPDDLLAGRLDEPAQGADRHGAARGKAVRLA